MGSATRLDFPLEKEYAEKRCTYVPADDFQQIDTSLHPNSPSLTTSLQEPQVLRFNKHQDCIRAKENSTQILIVSDPIPEMPLVG